MVTSTVQQLFRNGSLRWTMNRRDSRDQLGQTGSDLIAKERP